MYEVFLARKASKFLSKLPSSERKRIFAVIDRARIRPEKFFERLVGVKAYKLRAGDYRIIADILKGELRILVIKIGHRYL